MEGHAAHLRHAKLVSGSVKAVLDWIFLWMLVATAQGVQALNFQTY